VLPSQALDFLSDLDVDQLPAVGWALKAKLAELGITRVRQVWAASKEQLQRHLGAKTGTRTRF
jgi:DNA repair protein REV1